MIYIVGTLLSLRHVQDGSGKHEAVYNNDSYIDYTFKDVSIVKYKIINSIKKNFKKLN